MLFIDLIPRKNLWTMGYVHFHWPESSNDSISDLARVCSRRVCLTNRGACYRTKTIWQTDSLCSVLTQNSLFHGLIIVTLRKNRSQNLTINETGCWNQPGGGNANSPIDFHVLPLFMLHFQSDGMLPAS